MGDPGEVADGYPLPFHPLDLGAAALPEVFGFQLEGIVDSSLLAPERIRLLRFDDPDKASKSKAADPPTCEDVVEVLVAAWSPAPTTQFGQNLPVASVRFRVIWIPHPGDFCAGQIR